MSLGDKLRQRRQEMGLTRPQLAAKICVTPSAIANYENGISTPKPDILISLINVLEVDANYMYSDYLGNSQIIKIYDHSLSSEEVDAIKKYRELSKEGKRLVRLIINEEYSRTTVGNQLSARFAKASHWFSYTKQIRKRAHHAQGSARGNRLLFSDPDGSISARLPEP